MHNVVIILFYTSKKVIQVMASIIKGTGVLISILSQIQSRVKCLYRPILGCAILEVMQVSKLQHRIEVEIKEATKLLAEMICFHTK